MTDIHQHILTLLEDTSFPPLVLLDGAWGEGKTYYTENTLIPELTKQKKDCVFFSLTGLSSISDFKDRLLSTSLLNEQLNSEQGNAIKGMFSTLLSSLGGDTGGNISSILGGATGLIKESLLSRIKDKYILIDDLDRVNDKDLCNLIIGECLQLIDSKNDLKFIFIVNNKECKADKKLKEKVFSGIVKLNRSVSDSIKIAFEDYGWFNTYQHQIFKVIQDKKVKNLRVLKRCSKKINTIYELLKSDNNLDVEKSMYEVINGVVIVSYYHYEEGLNELQIKANSEYSLKKKEKESVKKFLDLQNIRYFLTDGFISYCVGGSNWNISLNDLGRLPIKACPIDTFLFKNNFDLNDDEFNKNLEILYDYVFSNKHVEFLKWFEACYYYDFLQQNYFIPDEKLTLSDCFNDLIKEKIFDYSDLKERNHRLKINDTESYIYKEYETEKNKHYKEQEQTDNDNLLDRMSESWSKVDILVYEDFRAEEFFSKFTLQQLQDCIKNWQNNDLALFSDFIHVRFKDTNNKKYLAPEISILKQLSVFVKKQYEKELKGRRKGSLYSLLKNLTAIKHEDFEKSQNK